MWQPEGRIHNQILGVKGLMTWARYFTLTVPFFTQEYKKEVAKCQHKGGGGGEEGKGKPGVDIHTG